MLNTSLREGVGGNPFFCIISCSDKFFLKKKIAAVDRPEVTLAMEWQRRGTPKKIFRQLKPLTLTNSYICTYGI